MKKAFVLFGLIFNHIAYAQRTIDLNKDTVGFNTYSFYTVNGSPVLNTKYVKVVEGSPYLTENWMKGSVIANNGYRYSGSPLRLDLLANELYYADQKGAEFISTIPARELWLEDTTTGTHYRFIHASYLPTAQNDRGWYQLLDSGKLRLYKTYKKMISESRGYNSSSYEQRIVTTEQFYISTDKTMTVVKKLKDLPLVLTDKNKEVEAYIKNGTDQNASASGRWIQAIRYYNSLSKKE